MAFSDYKHISQVQQEFTIAYREELFLVPHETPVPEPFLAEFLFNKEHFDVYSSEAARSELLIFPLLREVYKPHAHQCSLWIQKPLTYDDKLTGTTDYLVSARSPLGKTVVATPLLIAVEAKKNDFEQGWAQCAAELVAAQRLNGDANVPVYGIVTDGRFWEFGKLVEDIFYQNSEAYSADQLPLLFGVLQQLFHTVTTEVETLHATARHRGKDNHY
jgi:hypothetical protein